MTVSISRLLNINDQGGVKKITGLFGNFFQTIPKRMLSYTPRIHMGAFGSGHDICCYNILFYQNPLTP